MPKRYMCACPKCGSQDICGWYEDHNMQYFIQCNECGHGHSVLNIKYVEAFPDWFELFDDGEEVEEK